MNESTFEELKKTVQVQVEGVAQHRYGHLSLPPTRKTAYTSTQDSQRFSDANVKYRPSWLGNQRNCFWSARTIWRYTSYFTLCTCDLLQRQGGDLPMLQQRLFIMWWTHPPETLLFLVGTKEEQRRQYWRQCSDFESQSLWTCIFCCWCQRKFKAIWNPFACNLWHGHASTTSCRNNPVYTHY
jgi:hypothetical protein